MVENWTFLEPGLTVKGKLGSGYPSGASFLNNVFRIFENPIICFADPDTKAWLEKNMNPVFGFPNITRFSWANAKNLLAEKAVAVDWYVANRTSGTFEIFQTRERPCSHGCSYPSLLLAFRCVIVSGTMMTRTSTSPS